MERKIIAGTYTFVDEPEKLPQFTLPTNILFDDSNGTLINYATDLLPGISTDKFVLAVERPNETQKFLVYAFEDTTAGGALSVSKGWYWFNESSISLDAIPTPSVVFSDNCSINDELTTPEVNALFTTSPIQVQPTVTTTRVLYKGKKELTMAQFEALTTLDDAIDYDITDFPNGGITNAQMTAALGYSRLFGDGDVFVCLDNGTYTKGHTYQVKVTSGVKSWEDITPESTPATGTDIQVTELLPASAENVGKIVQFIKANEWEGQKPSQGHWYKCQPVVADEGRYEWVKQSVQDKDYIVNTSDGYSSGLENVGRMVYQDSGRNIYWLPYIALGELAQLVNYQGNITVHYTIEDDSYPGGLTKSDEMVWHADSNGWISTTTTGFYAISKQADMFGSETLTKPLYTATYMENDLVVTSRKITVTSIDLANGTSITIPTGYGEAKFYNYSIGAGYSSPIDFYSKFESGNLTDADIEAFRFMAINEVNPTFDINKLMVETEEGLKPLKDYLGGSPLYKHELVIPYSFSVGDSETVDGSVVYHYLSNTGTQIASASEIDDNFLLSGGIGKNTANTVLLLNINVIKAGSSITVEAVNASTNGYITGTVGTITDTVTQLI